MLCELKAERFEMDPKHFESKDNSFKIETKTKRKKIEGEKN